MTTTTKNDGPAETNREARLGAIYERLEALDMAPYWAVRNDKADHDEDSRCCAVASPARSISS